MRMNVSVVSWGLVTVTLGCGQAVAEQASGIEEVMVTAQRREQNLQDVPISVAALSGADLERMGVAAVSELNTVTPGFTITYQRNSMTPYLRGVGTATAVGAEEGTVPVYLDGILISSLTSAAFALPNVQRVEVLKGPQGTLFGRNSVGGMVNVITKDPSHTPGGSASISVGNFETLGANLYATGGLSETVAMDITAYVRNQGEGWGRNLNFGLGTANPHSRVDSYYRNEAVLRTKVLITPNDDLRITLMGDYQQLENEIGLVRDILPGATVAGGFVKVGSFYDTRGNLIGAPTAPQWGLAARVEYDFDFATFTSSSGYRIARTEFNFDQDVTPVALLNAPEEDQLDTFQQEFMLTGDSDRLEWTAGVFYFFSRADYDTSLNSTVVAPLNVRRITRQETNSYAAFGQATYRLTDRLGFTAGLRYTRDEREFSGRQIALAGNPAPTGTIQVNRNPGNDPTAELTNEEPTWRLAIDYRLTDDLLLFASYNRGFKSGIFNQTSPVSFAVQPETLDAYELGFKSDLFDRTLRFNGSFFYNDYQDVQLTRTLTGNLVAFNAPGAEIYGAEADVIFAPRLERSNLELRAAASYLHGRYKDFPNAPISAPMAVPTANAANVVTAGNAKDNDTIRTPPLTYTLSVVFDTPVSLGMLGFSLNYYYNDGFYWEVDNRLKQASYGLLNSEVSLTTLNDQWRLALFGQNLAGEEYYVGTTGGTSGDVGAPGAPRTYGINIQYNF